VNEECGWNPAQLHIPDAQDTARYTAAIKILGEIDVCFGGIGINGHVAFNEALDCREVMSNEDFRNLGTRVIRIAATTKVVNAIYGTGGDLHAVPDFAVTVGMKEILCSKRIRIYLDWFWQRQVLRNTLFGPVTPMFPASFLQEHRDVIITAAECAVEDPSSGPQ
jgi:glucosamine-6-phosphate deaminase